MRLSKLRRNGFTNQQALLILVIVFPLGLILIGIALMTVQAKWPQENQQTQLPKNSFTPPIAQTAVQRQVDPVDTAINTVNIWIQAMSDGDEAITRSLMTGSATHFYDPNFLSQFYRVSISDLQVTSRSGSFVNLNGIITFVYKDGTTQRETRSFSVQVINPSSPVITATEFIAVIKQRS